ncbi:MAG: 8-oxo-dGTP diphosphatase [Candidatus Saccharimonadales bacterium]
MNQKTLSLLFLRKDDQILLAMKKRGFGEGRWNGVGGKVEANETIEMAMIRESQEEIGVTPHSYEKIAEIHFDEFFKNEPIIMNVHVFICTTWTGEPIESDEMKPQWFALKDIPYAFMWADDPLWLPKVLEGKKINADFKLDPLDAILSHSIKEVEEFSE